MRWELLRPCGGRNHLGELLLGRDWADGNPQVNDDKFIRRNLNQKFTMGQAFTINFFDNLSLRANGTWFLNQTHYEGFNKDYLSSPGNWVRTRSSSASYDKTLSQTYNAVLNYNEKFADRHSVDAMAGWEFYDSYNNGLSASGSGAPTDDFMDLGLTSNEANRRSIDSYHSRLELRL